MQAGLDVMDDMIAIIESLLVLKVVDAVIPAAPNTTQPAAPRLAPNWSSQTGAGACVLSEWADAAKQQSREERQRCLSLT